MAPLARLETSRTLYRTFADDDIIIEMVDNRSVAVLAWSTPRLALAGEGDRAGLLAGSLGPVEIRRSR